MNDVNLTAQEKYNLMKAAANKHQVRDRIKGKFKNALINVTLKISYKTRKVSRKFLSTQFNSTLLLIFFRWVLFRVGNSLW